MKKLSGLLLLNTRTNHNIQFISRLSKYMERYLFVLRDYLVPNEVGHRSCITYLSSFHVWKYFLLGIIWAFGSVEYSVSWFVSVLKIQQINYVRRCEVEVLIFEDFKVKHGFSIWNIFDIRQILPLLLLVKLGKIEAKPCKNIQASFITTVKAACNINP